MFKDLEIGITSNNQLVCDYKRLDKAQQKKLYNVAVFSLALTNLDKLGKGILDLSGWSLFGINPIIIFLPIILMIVVAVAKALMDVEEWNLTNVLGELWWVLLALIPGLIGILLGISNFKIYI